jgi:hypothetical protein
LFGRGARDALDFETIHSARWIEQAAPLEPRVDDDAHAVYRETRLGDVGGQHDLAAARPRRFQRGILVTRGELSVQRSHVHAGANVAQHALHTPDLARARQEHQHVAVSIGECTFDRAQHAELG